MPLSAQEILGEMPEEIDFWLPTALQKEQLLARHPTFAGNKSSYNFPSN